LGKHFAGFGVVKIYMVALDQDLVIGALETVSPLFHCSNNRQQLLIVRVIGFYGWGAFLRVEIDTL
jgi:hypothetical protein